MEVAAVPQSDPNAIINVIADVAKTTNTDRFKIKINRRTPNGPYPVLFVAFDDATVDQIAHPENWLTVLGGGGVYQIYVFHPIETAKQIGQPITIQAGGPSKQEPIDPAVINDPNWRGPKEMTFPNVRPAAQRPQQVPFIGIPDPLDGLGAAPGPRLANGDQRSNGAAPSYFNEQRASLDREREELRRATLTIKEEQHQAEMRAERQRFELEIAKLRTEITAKPQGQDTLAAMMIEMNKQAQASAERLAEAQRRSDERFQQMMSQQQQALAAQVQSAQEMNKTLMTQLLQKPTIDPLMEKLLAKESEGAATTVKVVQQMAEATGSVVQMMVGALHAVSELNSGPAEPPWLGAVKEGIRAFASMQANVMTPQVIAPQVMAPPGTVLPAAQQPAPAPAPAPAAPKSFDGVDGSKLNAFDQIIMAIRQRRNPTEVATFFLDNVNEPTIQAKLAAAGGNPLNAFGPHLMDWIQADPQNGPYINALLKEVDRIYKERAAQGQQGEEEEEDDGNGEPEDLG